MNKAQENGLKYTAILKQYAEENQVPPRSTSDLSPLEQWLILKLVEATERINVNEE